MKTPQPPRWMDRLLEWYCRPHLLEDLQGDLHEYYARRLPKGKFRANLIYLLDVIKFFRFYTIRTPKTPFKMTALHLLSNYSKTAFRSLLRNRLFATINVTGLAISMSVGLLVITMIAELLRFDHFHENKDRIYRILTDYKSVDSDDLTRLASTSIFIGKKLEENYPGIASLAILRRHMSGDFRFGEKVISASGHWASADFFQVFSFQLLAGNPATALREPNTVVITETLAEKLFGETNPVGQLLTVAGQERYQLTSVTVTGVVKDPPINSHIQFEILGSLATLEQFSANSGEATTMVNQYSSVWMNHVYLLLAPGVSPPVVQGHLDQIAKEEGARFDRFTISYTLEHLLDIVPGENHSNQIGPTVEWSMIYVLSALCLIVVLSACFNYTNLSVARSLHRSREVGIRKVVGAGRSEVFVQFILEAVIVAVLALAISGGMFLLLRPQFLQVFQDMPIALQLKGEYIGYFLLFAVVVGLMAGFLPALLLSRIKTLSVMRNISRFRIAGSFNIRRVLLVVQMMLSIGLIVATSISYQQYRYLLNFDLGYKTDQIINLELKANDPEILIAELLQLPEVTGISRSAMIHGTGDTWANTGKYKDPMDSATVVINYVTPEYLELHGFRLLAGSTFSHPLKKDEKQQYVIVNETLLERFQMGTPEEALGEKLVLDEARHGLTIVGVVQDFQHSSLTREVEPFAFLQNGDEMYWLNLKINTTDMLALLGKMEAIWKKVDQVHPFEAKFYNDQIEDTYSHFQVFIRVIGFLSFLAISISAMGLLGMAVFTTETRIKEISIRKVLGATEWQLIYLLSRGFLVLLGVASAIALPVTYFIFEQWVLADYVQRINIGLLELISGVVIIVSIGVITIGWQTAQAAGTNPAEMLRSE